MEAVAREELESRVLGAALAFPQKARSVPIEPRHFADSLYRTIARSLIEVLAADDLPHGCVVDAVARRIPGAANILWRLAEAAATPETLPAYVEKLRDVAEPAAQRKRMQLRWLPDIEPRLDAAWRVQGLLPQRGLAVVFGESGSGKTFATLDIALHVASGRAWASRRCRPAPVIYIAAENPASVENRIAAVRLHRPDLAELARLAVLPQAVDLHDPSTDLPELLALLKAVRDEHEQVGMVVVDTLARAMAGGDENSAADMSRVVRACDLIAETLQTAVVLVHHAGKNSEKGARGSSALRAAADVEILVESSNGGHQARVTKSRDGETGASFVFRLEQVRLGVDAEGEAVTSCVVADLVEQDAAPEAARPAKLSTPARLALDALHEILEDKSRRRSAPAEAMAAGARVGQWVATVAAWREACYARSISDGKQNAKRMAFERAAQSLQTARRVQVYGDFVWLSNE